MKLYSMSMLVSILLTVYASSSNPNELILKSKRATIYYLCGSYPNQYYSYTPCSSNGPQKYLCSNQGTYLGMTCSFSAQCTQIYTLSSCIDGFCCTLPTITTTSTPIPVIPVCGGYEPSNGRCRSDGYCSSGYVCTANNVCCRCLTGASAGSCANGVCPTGYLCNANNYCCAYDITPVQRCIYGQCPTGYSCGAGQICYPIIN